MSKKNTETTETPTLTLKKTMLGLHAILLSAQVNTLVDASVWDKIIAEMTPKTPATGTVTPREITILKDAEQNVIGRMCTLSKKWFPISEFFKGTAVIKSLDQEKAKIYNAAKKMEKDADAIRDEAKTAETPEEKLAVYERYETAIDEAKLARAIEVDPAIIETASVGGFDTIEGLAVELGVVLGETANIPKPKEEKVETAEDTATVEA